MAPGSPPDPRLQAAIDHSEITRLQSQYADVVNRRAWAELGELMRDDMVLELDTVTSPAREIVGPEAVGGFIDAAVARFAFFEFAILSAHVEVDPADPDVATARLWMCEHRCGHETGSPGDGAGPGEWSTAYGLYRDSYRRIDGRWWFAHRRYRSLARTGNGGGVFPLPDPID